MDGIESKTTTATTTDANDGATITTTTKESNMNRNMDSINNQNDNNVNILKSLTVIEEKVNNSNSNNNQENVISSNTINDIIEQTYSQQLYQQNLESNINLGVPIVDMPQPLVMETTIEEKKLADNSVGVTNKTTTTAEHTKDGTIIQQKEQTSWFSSLQNSVRGFNTKIKQLFISPETEEALGTINSLFTKFFKDVPYSKFEMLTGLLLLDSYYKNSHIRSGEHLADRDFIRLSSHYMRFAAASFGSKYVYSYMQSKSNVTGFIQGVTGTDNLNIKVLCEYTGVSKEDVICHKFTSTNFDPGHFITLDRSTKSIVLSIRGTFHARDVLTDLVATNSQFLDGYAHTGILKCAQKKYKELAPILLEVYQKNEGYKFVVVGHSLGAGTAALFTLLFNSEHPELPIHCYAFAPPCVTSLEIALSKNCQNLITSYVLNNDVIPRLSYQSLEHLKQLVCSILKNNSSRVFQILTAGNALGEDLTNKISNFFKLSREVKIDFNDKSTLNDHTMLPPGEIYRIFKITPFDKHHIMEKSNPSLFGEIIISGSLLTDHLPDNYENALISCLKLLNDITPEPKLETDFVLLEDKTNNSTVDGNNNDYTSLSKEIDE